MTVVSVNFPSTSHSTSNRTLPPPLAKIAHDEVVLIELQGTLEVECTDASQRDGRLVGKLRIDESGNKPTLMIGHHLLEGKLANLPKPLAVLFRSGCAEHSPARHQSGDSENDPDWKMADDDDDPDRKRDTQGERTSWEAVAIVKRKILFSKRPMPIIGGSLKGPVQV